MAQLDAQPNPFFVPYLGVTTSESVKNNQHFVLPSQNGPKTQANTSHPIFQTNLLMGTDLLLIGVKRRPPPNSRTVLPLADSQTALPRTVDGVTGPKATSFAGLMVNGSYVPAGNYSIMEQALKIFGNRANPRDYDIVHSVNFGITYAAPATN